MSKEFEVISEKIKSLAGIEQRAAESEVDTILRGLSVLEVKFNSIKTENDFNTRRINSILEIVMSLAQLDYAKKAELSDRNDEIDALAAGINMLGEELNESTVSSKEKDILLKEVHHRVKNNLQIISSLLNLQSGQIEDPVFREKYNVSRDRIRSMALVHEKLHESQNQSLIDFGDYVNSLSNSLNVSYNPGDSRIEMELNVEEKTGLLKIETAIPCGLILNELLSNSFKYAFPENRKGKIEICFTKTCNSSEKSKFRLTVKDNGIGLPQNFDLKNTESLGFQLITILTEQLNAELVIHRENGLEVSLHFIGE